MKKLIYAALGILLATGLLALGAKHFENAQSAATGDDRSGKVLNIYNWGPTLTPL